MRGQILVCNGYGAIVDLGLEASKAGADQDGLDVVNRKHSLVPHKMVNDKLQITRVKHIDSHVEFKRWSMRA